MGLSVSLDEDDYYVQPFGSAPKHLDWMCIQRMLLE